MGDFNLEPSTEHIETLCHSFVLHNLVKKIHVSRESPNAII